MTGSARLRSEPRATPQILTLTHHGRTQGPSRGKSVNWGGGVIDVGRHATPCALRRDGAFSVGLSRIQSRQKRDQYYLMKIMQCGARRARGLAMIFFCDAPALSGQSGWSGLLEIRE